MSTPHLALNLYSVRQFTQTSADIVQTLKKVKQAGYDWVQLSGMGQIDPKDVRKMLDDAGLGACATHMNYVALRDSMDTIVKNHHLWGVKNTALSSLPPELRDYDGYLRYAREGSEWAKKLTAEGITLSYHNHSFELQKYNGRLGLDILYEDSDPSVFFAEIDTYWIQYGGGDPAAWIGKLKGRQPLVHVKDMTVIEGKPIFAEVGEGNLNWPAIMQACKAAGVEWYIVEQDECQRDPFESIAISARNLKVMGVA